MKIAILKKEGLHRVLNGEIGMSFPIEQIISRDWDEGFFIIVRDYRYPGDHFPYQKWSIDGSQVDILENLT